MKKYNQLKLATALVITLSAIGFSSPAEAHLTLRAPLGGDTLEVGETIEIRWSQDTYHGIANFDIEYSRSSGNNLWLVVANAVPTTDTLDGTEYSFSWVVPNNLSTTFRVRVSQINIVYPFNFTDSSGFMTVAILDSDADGLLNYLDNCPFSANPSQQDSDADGVGDACDACPGFDDTQDADSDNVPDGCDNCPSTPNPSQSDSNSNGIGDACDICCIIPGDVNNDGSSNIADVTFLISRIFSGGAIPPCCEQADPNGDGSANIADVTFLIARIFSGGPPPVCGSAGSC